ncbi:MAG: hypothetical protein U9N86_12425 [Bacteroidota bacterium]|nr:hypothetical protein [Bacteroidota bacterium]
MATTVVLNDIDFSEIVGEPMYFGDSCFIPIVRIPAQSNHPFQFKVTTPSGVK